LESGADVVIDFSSPQGTLALAKRAEELGIALVIGTTAKVRHFKIGLFFFKYYLHSIDVSQDFAWRADVKKSSAVVPLIHAHNFSLGVNLMCKVKQTNNQEFVQNS
jgi:dihydrodipicolinate reductase